ncbi:hypothetical protein FIBSPDRAFT_871581 [Athelia psychrophila]|uniref:Ribosomal protein S13/S15 N-terminal domain-containing protein n=1 Tax=Athelia psychrophila TaxID=1759441 RepID=A0A166A956_9AGAM|nr:hypothetical protein FIBSPDRAFT_871581 [Fibularhizoctonia sp. CBS 109695]
MRPHPPSSPPPQSSCADCFCYFSSPRSRVSPLSLLLSILYGHLFFGHRIGTVHPRGPLVARQKGGRCAQAPRGQPQGQDSRFRLILIESRIHRLARYYKTKQQIPPTFKYDSATASTLIA